MDTCSWAHERSSIEASLLQLSNENTSRSSFRIENLHNDWTKKGLDLGIDLGQISSQFEVHFGVLGGLGGSWGPQAPKTEFSLIFPRIFGPLLRASRLQLGGLAASWGVLGRFEAVLSPFFFRNTGLSLFGSILASIWDPKTTSKSCQNRTKIHASIDLGKTAYFQSS